MSMGIENQQLLTRKVFFKNNLKIWILVVIMILLGFYGKYYLMDYKMNFPLYIIIFLLFGVMYSLLSYYWAAVYQIK